MNYIALFQKTEKLVVYMAAYRDMYTLCHE